MHHDPASNTLGTALFFKLSLAQWSLHKSILEHKTLPAMNFAQKARELGFDAVEYVTRVYALPPGAGAAAINGLAAELKNSSDDNGLANLLIMIDREGELAATTRTGREEAIDRHKLWADAAVELGCHSIRVNLLGSDTNYAAWKSNAADGLSKLAHHAAKNNLNVVVENHGGFSSHAGKLTNLLRDINMPNVGTLPDFGNFCIQREGNKIWPSPCIEQYDKYLGVEEMMPFAKGVSAKAYDFDADGNETTIDYVRMMGIIKRSGYRGYIGIEYEGSIMSEEEGIKATVALLYKAALTV